MLDLLDTITDVFFSPSKGLSKASRVSIKKTVLFYFVFLLLIFWPMMQKLYPVFNKAFFPVLFILKYFISLAVIFLFTALLNGIATFLYKKNVDTKSIFSTLIFCLLPFVFLPLVYGLFASKGVAIAENILYFWSFVLSLQAVRKLYNISFVKSFIILMLPFVFVLSFHILLFTYLVTLLGGLALSL